MASFFSLSQVCELHSEGKKRKGNTESSDALFHKSRLKTANLENLPSRAPPVKPTQSASQSQSFAYIELINSMLQFLQSNLEENDFALEIFNDWPDFQSCYLEENVLLWDQSWCAALL